MLKLTVLFQELTRRELLYQREHHYQDQKGPKTSDKHNQFPLTVQLLASVFKISFIDPLLGPT